MTVEEMRDCKYLILRARVATDVCMTASRESNTVSFSANATSRGVLLGRAQHEWIWSGHERSTLVLGPTRSGKTTSVIVPNLLCATHGVVSTSTKPDVMNLTATSRSRAGSTLLFDPTGLTSPAPGVSRIGWSPLGGARQWDGALAMSAGMVAAAQRKTVQSGPADHWSERASSLLSCLLHAAALTQEPIATVVRWADTHQGHDALDRLESMAGPHHPSTSLLVGILATDSREQSGIWSTTSGVLGAYRSLGALDAAAREQLDPEEFVAGAHTLYVCATGRQQALLAPLVVGLMSEIQSAAYKRNRSDAPVLFALDELANIAPLPDLPQLVSEGGGQGVITLASLQDLSQARARWGQVAEGFLSLFSTTMVLGGVADATTLRHLSALSGHHEVARTSLSTAQNGSQRRSWSLSRSHQREERLSVQNIASGQPGKALVLDASNRLGYVSLTTSYRDEPWRSLTDRDRQRDLGRAR